MPKLVTLQEALENGYEILGPEYIEPTPPEPTTFDQSVSIGLEVVPAIVGGFFGFAGAAAGGAAGNAISQWYRNANNMQEGFSGGELAAATAFSTIPGGQLKGVTAGRKIVTRGAQGAAIATGELTTRVAIERGELPTASEVQTTLLFGGAFGGTLGAVEAKFLSNNFGHVKENSTRTETLDQLEKTIKETGVDGIPPTGQDLLSKLFSEGATWEQVKNHMDGMPNPAIAKMMMESAETAVARQVDDVVLGTLGKHVDEMNEVERMIHDQSMLMEFAHSTPSRSYSELKGLNSTQRKAVTEADSRIPNIEKEWHLADTPQAKSKLTREKNKLIKARDEALAKLDEDPAVIAAAKKKALALEKKKARALAKKEAADKKKAEAAAKKKKAEVEVNATKGAKELADEVEVNITEVTGTGAKGRVTKADVLAHRVASPPRDAEAGGIAPPATAAKKGEASWVLDAEWGHIPRFGKSREYKITARAEIPEGKFGTSTGEIRVFKASKEEAGWVLKESKIDQEGFIVRGQETILGGKPLSSFNNLKAHVKALLKKERPATAAAPVARSLTEEAPKQLELEAKDKIKRMRAYEAHAENLNRELDDLRGGRDEFGDVQDVDKKAVTLKEKELLDYIKTIVVDDITPFTDDLEGWEFALDQFIVGGLEDAEIDLARVAETKGQGAKSPTSKSKFGSKLKDTAIPSLIAAGAGGYYFTEEDIKSFAAKAGVAEWVMFILLAGVAKGSLSRIMKNVKARGLKNPELRKQAAQHLPRRNNGDTRGDELRADAADPSVIYRDKSFFRVLWEETKSDLSHVLNPMSRILKNIDRGLTRIFRDHEMHINKIRKKYISEVEPFVTGMERAIKGKIIGKIKNKEDWKKFRVALRNAEEEPAREVLLGLMKKYNPEVLAYNRKHYKRNEGAVQSYNRMNAGLKDVRRYAREDGGLDVGERAHYFPSALKDYDHFKSEMIDSGIWKKTDFDKIDKEIEAFEEKWKSPPSPEEQSEIATRVLTRIRKGQGGTSPSHVEHRTLDIIDERMIDAYVDPSEVMSSYIDKMVTATERRKFLGLNQNAPQPVRSKDGIEKEGFIESDLGLTANYEDSIGAYVMRQREKGAWNVTDKQADEISKVINARFNSKGSSAAVSLYKNSTYLALLGNFGAAITQLGDLAYSIHFNGLGNTFRAAFDKKDWYTHMGLNSSDIDLVSSRDGLSKVLNHVLEATQFKRLDKFGKNMVMRSTFIRMSREAKANPNKLLTELRPMYGKQISNKIRNDLISGNLSDDVESVIWNKFLDLQPAALSEMPMNYAEGSRLIYTLKTFTIKQWDVFRESANGHLGNAHNLAKKGNYAAAAKEGALGLKGVVSLAAWFAAANGATSLIKDTMYGREVNYDDLQEDLVWRLIGASRYLSYQARTEGMAKATLEFFMPATTAFDRAQKDLKSLAQLESPTALLQGMPGGDFWYWHEGGGREKTRKEIAKMYGLKLEHVPE